MSKTIGYLVGVVNMMLLFEHSITINYYVSLTNNLLNSFTASGAYAPAYKLSFVLAR